MFDAPLTVTPLSASWPSARLDAFVWGGARADFAVWISPQQERWVVRSRVRRGPDGVLRRLRVRSVVENDAPREIDRSTFELHDDRFVELATDGTSAPLVLPATLLRDEPATPDPDRPETVRMRFAGPVRLEVAGVVAERNALLLRLGTPSDGWDQWMVQGVGEVTLGPADADPHRWLVAWRAGDQSDLLFAAPRG